MDTKQLAADIEAKKLLVKSCKEQFRQAESDLALLETSLAEAEEPKLDYSKPIIASSGESIFLLVANCDMKSYESRGYDWINIATGRFNSKYCWETAEEAVKSYSIYEGKPHNVVFDDLKAMAEDLEGDIFYLGSLKIALFNNILHLGNHGQGYPIEINVEYLSKLILNLRRMEATLKRKQNG